MPKREQRKLRLKIDKYALDEEAANFGDDFEYWAKKAARAKKRVADAKAEMKLTEAELTLLIRNNPGKFGFSSRPSDKMVEMKVLTCPEYRAAVTEFNEATYEQDQYEVAVSGLNHKRPLIEQLSFLHSGSYFSKPSERPRGVKKRRRDNA